MPSRRGFLAASLSIGTALVAAPPVQAQAALGSIGTAGDPFGGQLGTEPNSGHSPSPALHSPNQENLTVAIYRGPAAGNYCPESVANALAGRPNTSSFYIGPNENAVLNPETLKQADVYIQPGGGSVRNAWAHLAPDAETIRQFVRNGGTYLGFCLGGFLASENLGFGILPGISDSYSRVPNASIKTESPTIASLLWAGRRVRLYSQGAPVFYMHESSRHNVVATYLSGHTAAAVASYGRGKVGVVGPHPEADQSWFDDDGLYPSGALHPELVIDLLDRTRAFA